MPKSRKMHPNPYCTDALSVPLLCALVCSNALPEPLLIQFSSGYAVMRNLGALVMEAKLRHRMLGRLRGRIPQTPPFNILLAHFANSGGRFGRRLNGE
jgi:hypothetical protein